MPVHDWTRVDDGAFHDSHCSWVVEIKRALMRGILPAAYYVMAERRGGDVGAPAVHASATIAQPAYTRTQRTLVIRHVSDDRIVAMIGVFSRGNKASRQVLDKAVAALEGGIHLLLIDVHPPGPRDPNGIHGAITDEIGTEEYTLGEARPLTVAAYVGGASVEALVTHFAVGEPVPPGPLFLSRDNYVTVPLEAAYLAAWEDVPPRYKQALLAVS
jgi:hypothetical protein